MPNFTGFLKKAFPFISAAASVGGPIGTMAANAIGAALKVNAPDPTPDAIANTIAAAIPDPEKRAQVQLAEAQLAKDLQALGYQHAEEVEQIAADDRANARAREIATKDWYPKLLASVVVVLCFLGEGIYFRRGAPANASPELIGRILGTLDSALILVLGYYFGSSVGSDRKTELLAGQQQSK